MCSSSYPVISYTVNVADDQGIRNTVTFNSRDSDNRSDKIIQTALKLKVHLCSSIYMSIIILLLCRT